MEELAVGATFADHVIRGVAGRGGMGIVYRATHLPLKREVALKVIAAEISEDEGFRLRFRRECEAAASIEHPNLVPIYHAGEQDGLLFVTMRYVEGTDLARLIVLEQRLDPVRAVGFVAQIANALDAAHARGVVHRDVKPANVLIEGRRALLTDFGLNKDLRAAKPITESGTVIGTFDYTAPEQIEGNAIDGRADVYALGCVLFEALTGGVPFPRDTVPAKMFAHVSAPPPLLSEHAPDAPPELETVIATALAKSPEDRYASAGALGAAALAAVEGRPVARAVSRVSTTPRSIPLPPALASELGGAPFVGREPELDALGERYARAEQGQRQALLVTGEAGIGKTRLVAEFARRAQAAGATVLHGRSDTESLVPYQPFIAALQHYIAHRETLEFPPELEEDMGELARFVPALRRSVALRGAPPDDESEARRFRMFEAVTRVLAFIAHDHPTVLVLDDLQWADHSTALLLGHLLQDPQPVRLFVLATVRDGDPAPALARLLSRVRGEDTFARLPLTGLDVSATAKLAGPLSESVAVRLHAETDGNPFFLTETLRSLAEAVPEGADDRTVDSALSALAVPEGVQQLIGHRLSRLSDTAGDVLNAAAVVGREFRLEFVEGLIDAPEDRVLAALEEAVAAGLLREVEEDAGRFVFSHALVREAVYERQSGARRVRLHRRIAERLEAVGAAPAELAYHCFEGRHAPAKAAAYAERAAAEAVAAFAYGEAAEHYRRALATAPADPERRAALLLALGRAELRSGSPQARETLSEAAAVARAARLPEALAQAAIAFGERYNDGGPLDEEAVALLEEGLAALGARESPLTVQLLARLSVILHFHDREERRYALSADALAMARRLGDPDSLLIALESRQTALFHIAHLGERLALTAELLELARAEGEPELIALALHRRTYNLIEAAEMAAARAAHAELRELADRLRLPLYQHIATCWDTVWAQLAGDFDRAERLAFEAFEFGRRAQARDVETSYPAQLVALAYWRGHMSRLVPALQAWVAQNPHLLPYRAALALAHLQAGDRDAGVAEFERLAAGDFLDVPRDLLWFNAVCLLAEACALIGDAARATLLYELIVPYRARNVQIAMITCWGSAERYLGLLAVTMGERERAVEHFEAALAASEACGMRHAIGVIRAEYATALSESDPARRA